MASLPEHSFSLLEKTVVALSLPPDYPRWRKRLCLCKAVMCKHGGLHYWNPGGDSVDFPYGIWAKHGLTPCILYTCGERVAQPARLWTLFSWCERLSHWRYYRRHYL